MTNKMSGVDRAIGEAGGGPEGVRALADLVGVSPQAIYNFRRRGYFPLGIARPIAERYAIPLADLVKDDLAAALRATS